MTLNWNTLTALPKSTNDFGQPLLDDYGQDNLWPMIASTYDDVDPTTLDRLDAQVDAILGDDNTLTAYPVLTAIVTRDEPAMVTHPVPVQPIDFADDGLVWWIGPDATIGCDPKMIDAVGDLAERGGWLARTGVTPMEYGIVVQPYSDAELDGPVANHKAEYALWQMVRETLIAEVIA